MEHERSVRPRPEGEGPVRRAPVRRGRPSPGVLLGRWVLVLSALAAVVTVAVLGVRGIAGAVSTRLASPDPTPTVEETGSAAPAPCTTDDVTLTLVPDATAYTIGSQARFRVTTTHVGTVPCTLDNGNAGREVVVTSGSDRIWSSADCDTVGEVPALMSPGDVLAAAVEWQTDRSVPGCTPDQPAPRPGTYQAGVAVGEVASERAVFTLQ